MPRELEFKLMTSKRLDNEANARKSQIEITSGGKTINERRSELGLPLLDTPQADMPILQAGSTTYLFSPDGIIDAATAAGAPALEGPNATPIKPVTQIGQKPKEEPGVKDEEEIDNETKAEVKAFMKWANKGKRARLFEFKALDPIVGDALNRCAYEGDLESARALAKAYLT
jgi:hypothetical protein